jgi:chromosome segregation ATPase
VGQLSSLADSIGKVSEHVGGLDRQAREAQETARRGAEENLARLQRDAVKGLEEALRPATQHLATLGETVRNATQQLSGLDRHAQEHQATVARSVETSVGKLQQDASRAVEEVMRGATTQLATLQQGIAALNQTLTELNGKQVVIQQGKSGGVLSRMLGKG